LAERCKVKASNKRVNLTRSGSGLYSSGQTTRRLRAVR